MKQYKQSEKEEVATVLKNDGVIKSISSKFLNGLIEKLEAFYF